MIKPLLCLIVAFLVAVAVLQLRQQRRNLNYQANQLHDQIESKQSRLWTQQLQIAIFTAPNAIAKTVGQQKLNMKPQSPLPPDKANWLGVSANPDAE